MKIYLKLFIESVVFALSALATNKLRTVLSLLGITIGIFSIISVFTLVDSLERSIRNSIEDLGNNVIFVQKWPWQFSGDYNWWDYLSRPQPGIDDRNAIETESEHAAGSCYQLNFQRTIKFSKNSIESADIISVTDGYEKVRSFEVSKGRYFTDKELYRGVNVAVVGNQISKDLFGLSEAEGKMIKVGGRKARVIGVFKREGESMVGFSMDNKVVLPYNFSKSLVNVTSSEINPTIFVRAREGVDNQELREELTGILRAQRRLRPREDNNFALNEISVISQGLSSLFDVLHIIGWVIGGFSILVGGFSIANIMFVSVRERSRIIGIQKALGAKNGFILFQFLSESVILALIGGSIGLIIILIMAFISNFFTNFEVVLSAGNIALGVGISAIIGILAGVIPALRAAKKDPVEAIRN